jgi:hypothetical protein
MTRSWVGIAGGVVLIVQIRKYICHNRVSTQLRRLAIGVVFRSLDVNQMVAQFAPRPRRRTVSRVYGRETVGGCPRGSTDAIAACLVGFWGGSYLFFSLYLSPFTPAASEGGVVVQTCRYNGIVLCLPRQFRHRSIFLALPGASFRPRWYAISAYVAPNRFRHPIARREEWLLRNEDLPIATPRRSQTNGRTTCGAIIVSELARVFRLSHIGKTWRSILITLNTRLVKNNLDIINNIFRNYKFHINIRTDFCICRTYFCLI